MSFPIVFDLFPDLDNPSKREPMLLKPNETVKVSLDKNYDKLAKFINSRQLISLMQKVEVEIGFIT